jgi:zinc-binding alcohol dehydrogenase/oxidoreductase
MSPAPAVIPATHRAAVLRVEGEPLELLKVDTPVPQAGEALVRLQAAALNHRDLWMRKGAYGKMVGIPCTLGSDGYGVVAQVGSAQDIGWVGRSVVINPSLDWGAEEGAPGSGWRILGVPDSGTFAQYICISVSQLFVAPDGWTAEEAAALPLAGITAFRALFTRGGLPPNSARGQRVLLTGIGGGVAQWALRMARAAGADVWVTSGSPEKLDAAQRDGAAGGVLYTDAGWGETLAKAAGLFDLCVDSAGGAGWAEIVDALKPGGRLVFFGATRGAGEIPMRKAFFKQLSILGTSMGSPYDFADLLAFVSKHDLRPPIDSVFDLDEVEKALARMDAGEQSGKIVLRIP